jgi:glycine dehydrogenase
MMVEPTESESKTELDRFCDAMIAIRDEITEIENGRISRDDNPLKNSPHTAAVVTATEWAHPYPRERAAFPSPATREHKFWPPVGRLNNVLGDRKLFCVCPPIESTQT